MGFRFRRRLRVMPGITINLSKSGASMSAGPRGAKVTIGHGKLRRTVGIPGTGLSYTGTKSVGSASPRASAGDARRSGSGGVGSMILGVVVVIGVLWLVGSLLLH